MPKFVKIRTGGSVFVVNVDKVLFFQIVSSNEVSMFLDVSDPHNNYRVMNMSVEEAKKITTLLGEPTFSWSL